MAARPIWRGHLRLALVSCPVALWNAKHERNTLAAVYRKASDEVAEIYAGRGRPTTLTDAQYQRLMAGGSYLWDHIGGAHVLPGRCLKKRDMPPRVKKYG